MLYLSPMPGIQRTDSKGETARTSVFHKKEFSSIFREPITSSGVIPEVQPYAST
ncbi:hypothetical protein PAECIP111802_05614 [Paenibacillus allorhizosphaerae]|uniref:Uncharacterized protein n=1 Tax=Paenibacillus allorhizosphaerae TaxID=2849866 RepID=A0ABN7TSW4_9BACL|nr:hypothetical protein PAECIP111802_05614 [Paenibacillus allorhizosphaerae]